MEFEKFDLAGIWSDFSVLSVREEAMGTCESTFVEWKRENKGDLERAMRVDGQKYNIKFYPAAPVEPNPCSFPETAEEMARKLFRINSELVIVSTGEGKGNIIKEKNVPLLTSILRGAANVAKFQIPIFIPVGNPKNGYIMGFRECTNTTTIYNSKPEKDLSIDSYEALFKKTFTNAKNVGLCKRNSYVFGEDDFAGSDSHYSNVEFFAKMKTDPIQDIHMWTLTDKETAGILDSNQFSMRVDRLRSPVDDCALKRFNSLLDIKRRDTTWDQLNSEPPSSLVKIQIEKIFQECELSKETTCLKASPKGSLLARLAVSIVSMFDISDQPVIDFAALWKEFLRIVRYRYDHKMTLPGVGLEDPDFEHCLLYQKLQMINICMKDVQKEEDQEMQKTLLSGEKMISPGAVKVIQTEDEVLDVTILLEKNAENIAEKAKIQSEQLQGEMTAFKSANPTAVFADFVRWFSPRDFDEETKELSPRMCEDGNVWVHLWNRVEAGKIDRVIFNPIAKAEAALDYLETLCPMELIGDLMPVLLAEAYFRLKDEANTNIAIVADALQSIKVNAIDYFHREVENAPDNFSLEQYAGYCEAAIDAFAEPATTIASAKSLLMKLPGCEKAVSKLLNEAAFTTSNDEEKQTIQTLLKTMKTDKLEHCLESREVIVWGETGSSIYSHIMVVTNSRNNIIATAFSEEHA